MKKCPDCKNTKDISEFHASKFHKGNASPRCKPCAIIAASKWYQENKAKKQAYDAIRRQTHKESFRAASKRNRENRPAEKKADTIARRFNISERTPKWANFKYMNIFYKIAKDEEMRTGRKIHVDHIVPIKNDLVCGLHCEHNLQLLFASDNLSKNNHYSIECQGIK